MSSTLRYAVQTHESTFSDSLLSNLPVAPPIIVLALLLLLAIGTADAGAVVVVAVGATDAAAGGTALLPLLLVLLPATADAAVLLLFFDAPLNLAQLNLSPQLPFLDLAPVEGGAVATAVAEPACLDC